MIGGYRNQVIRYIAFIAHAKMNNISQLLLPSIVWSTTYKKSNDENMFFPIPMSALFDVEYWNSFHEHLPVLVDSVNGDSDCWDVQNPMDGFSLKKSLSTPRNRSFISPMTATILESSALLTPVLNTSRAYLTGHFELKPRQLDLIEQVEHCTNPVVYGGGNGIGRMWTLYMSLSKGMLKVDGVNFTELISWASKALLPSSKWRDIAHQCISQQHASSFASDRQQIRNDDSSYSGYVALHPRVEVDMMTHRCGKTMEKNLTKIFNMVDELMKEYNKEPRREKLGRIFVAVSRRGMQRETKNKWVEKVAKENWKTLTERSLSNNNGATQIKLSILDYNKYHMITPAGKNKPPVFECGESWMDKWYAAQTDVEEDYWGSLVPSIMNFYIATNSAIFVGVEGSSWSTDVWTIRYYRGKGNSNFKYTPEGISPVPNGGLPDGHKKC